MIKFSIGVIFGIIVSTVGFQGMAALADHGVKEAKTVLQETATKTNTAK